MLKTLFNFVALFAFLTLACFVVALLYMKNNTLTFLIKPHGVPNGNKSFTLEIKEHIQQLSMESEASQQKIDTQVNKTLGPCPPTSPKLVGPLRVEFNFKRTLDEVRKEVGSDLQNGGRYKPPDCISQHKVTEQMMKFIVKI